MRNKVVVLSALRVPQVGRGVTLHSFGSLSPGTILRVSPSGRTIWFQLDALGGVPAAKRADGSTWTWRAVRQPDGVFRAGHEMWRVDVGVRRFLPYEAANAAVAGSFRDLANRVARIEPWLLRRRWYPMTYMAIPSVRRSAKELLAELASYAGPRRDEAEALHARLSGLRERFGRHFLI
jgi:hypothetical protein